MIFSDFITEFDRIAKLYGEHIAIEETDGQSLTYSELEVRSIKLAKIIIKSGVKKGEIVGLYFEKSADYVISILACWRAGMAFVPIKPSLPNERIAYIFADAKIKLCISSCGIDKRLLPLECVNICLDGLNLNDIDHQQDSLDTSVSIHAEDLAYLIYSSGTSGRPKGILIQHSGLVNILQQQIKLFGLSSESHSLFLLDISFDASISDLGTALLSGSCLVIAPEKSLRDTGRLIELIRHNRITHIDLPPALLKLIDPKQVQGSLQVLIVGGEVAVPDLVRTWAKYCRIINVYGPSEATICTSMCECFSDTWSRPLIGKAIEGLSYGVLNQITDTVDQFGTGELCISGVALAKEYLNDPELSAKKFIFKTATRWYRTGDLVELSENSDCEFLGRIDRMFKLRGMLIEPSEIELLLNKHSEVSLSAIVKKEVKGKNGSSRDILCAYIIPIDQSVRLNQAQLILKLRNYILEYLPRWMCPQYFEIIDSLPKTNSGKIDYQKLQKYELKEKVITGAECKTANDICSNCEIIIELFEKSLKVKGISAENNYPDLGGDSLAALELSVTAEALGIELDSYLICQGASIRELCGRHVELCQFDNKTIAGSELRKLAEVELFQIKKMGIEQSDFKNSSPVLITGASGFLGGRILKDLLDSEVEEVVCLIRATNKEVALNKIKANFKRYNLEISDSNLAKITPICSDISKVHLGLEQSDWQNLSNKIAKIYHCAAEVNLLSDFESLYQTNVVGTRNIAELALNGRDKELHYISTLSVFVASDQNKGQLLEDDNLDNTGNVYGGYAQTKYLAEVLINELAYKNKNIFIYRLGLITGDSKTGFTSNTDFLIIFLKGLSSLGQLPESCLELELDITPIDYASQAIIKISNSGTISRKFHIANKQGASLALIRKALVEQGRECKIVDDRTWKNLIRSNRKFLSCEIEAIKALCRFDLKNTYKQERIFDLFQASDTSFGQENTLAVLKNTNVKLPEINISLMSKYAAFAISKNSFVNCAKEVK